MRRIMSIVLIVILLITLVSCGRKENEIFSENARNGLKKSIELLESYKKYDISIDELLEGLEEVKERIETDTTSEFNEILKIKMSTLILQVKSAKLFSHVLDCNEMIESLEGTLYE